MSSADEVLTLLNLGKLEEAETLMREVSESDKKYWYTAGMLSFFQGNSEYATECFLKALGQGCDEDIINRSLSYASFFKENYLECFEHLSKVEKKTTDDYFIMFSCCSLLKDPGGAREYLNSAYQSDSKRTKELLEKFYNSFVKPSPSISENEKRVFIELVKSLNA